MPNGDFRLGGGGLLVCKVEKQRFDVNMIEFCRGSEFYFWGGGGMPGLKDGASYTYVCTKHVTGVTRGGNRSIDRPKPPLRFYSRARETFRLHVRLLDPHRLDDIPNPLLHLLAILPAFPPAVPCELRRRRPRPAYDPRDDSRLRHLGPQRRAIVGPLAQLEVVAVVEEGLIVRVVGLLAAVVVGLRAGAAAGAGVGLAVDDAGGGAAGAAVGEGGEGGEADADDAGGDFGGAVGGVSGADGRKGGWADLRPEEDAGLVVGCVWVCADSDAHDEADDAEDWGTGWTSAEIDICFKLWRPRKQGLALQLGDVH